MMLKLAGALAALATLAVSTADVAAHKARMDEAQEASYDLQEALDARDAAKTAQAERRLEGLLEAEQAYWAKADVERADDLARDNTDAARLITDRVALGDWPGAQQAFARMQAQCRNCHDLHLEKRVRIAP